MRRFIVCCFIILCFPTIVFSKSSSTIVMDVDSGRVLYSYQEHSKRLIASITKIMTCIIVLENYDLEDKIKVGEEVLQSYGTNIYIEPGEIISVYDLLYGLMLRSGNDAAITLANHIPGGEEKFVSLMNEKAKELGMKNTLFLNPHGLDDTTENISTAFDMALLSQYAYKNPIYQEIISTKRYQTKSSLKSYLWYNRVSLLNSYPFCVGGKNGYTPKAGKTLVSYAKKDDMTLMIVSLNDDSLYTHHQALYEEYFKQYQVYKIIDSKNFYIDPSLLSDKEVYIKEDFSYPLTEEELPSVSTFIQFYSSNQNDIVGKIQIKLDSNIIGEIPIYLKEIKKEDRKTIFQRIKDLFIR